jgi:hypothetical protein
VIEVMVGVDCDETFACLFGDECGEFDFISSYIRLLAVGFISVFNSVSVSVVVSIFCCAGSPYISIQDNPTRCGPSINGHNSTT